MAKDTDGRLIGDDVAVPPQHPDSFRDVDRLKWIETRCTSLETDVAALKTAMLQLVEILNHR